MSAVMACTVFAHFYCAKLGDSPQANNCPSTNSGHAGSVRTQGTTAKDPVTRSDSLAPLW